MNPRARNRLSGLRVLVVEDDATLRQLVRAMLEPEGATVSEAGTGREALAAAAAQAFDVALTDLGLPDMPGATLIAGIHAATSGRTSVAVVSGAAPDDLAHAVHVGAERAFAKPVDWDDLLRYLAHRRQAAMAGAGSATETESDMTVLLIEDDEAMRALLRDVLERAGHRVIERPDGAGVMALAEGERFDAVVLDKEMPGPDGLDLLSFLRARLPRVPVILVTAFGGPAVAAEAVRRGACRYLEKPFRMDAVLDALAEAARHHDGS
jgi:DNA-binding NtrC family response regulator